MYTKEFGKCILAAQTFERRQQPSYKWTECKKFISHSDSPLTFQSNENQNPRPEDEIFL